MTEDRDNRDTIIAWRFVSWVILAAVIVMTIWPFNLAPEGPISTGISRVLCYAALSLSFALAYPRRFLFATSVPIVCMIAHELLPMIVAGEHLDWGDTLRKALGIGIGVSIGATANWEGKGILRGKPTLSK
jgi:uncharacterized membrane protein